MGLRDRPEDKARFNNRGALWPSRPGEDGDLNGKINIDGVEYRIAAKRNPKYSPTADPLDPTIPELLLYHVPAFGEGRS